MRLYMLDANRLDPIRHRIVVDSDDAAERHVLDMHKDPSRILVFILCDIDSIRCVWRRSRDDVDLTQLPVITRVTTRFDGKWEHDVTPRSQLEPISDYERHVLTLDFALF